MDMEHSVKKTLKLSLEEGAKEAEAFMVRVRSMSVYVDDQMIKNVEEKIDQGVSIKVLLKKSLGQSSTTFYHQRDLEECVRKAIGLARLSPGDPYFKNFASNDINGSDLSFFHRDVAEADHSTIRDMATGIVEECSKGDEVKVPRGLLRLGIMEKAVGNTNGRIISEKGTLVYAHFTSMTKGLDPGEGNEAHYSPDLAALSPNSIGERLRSKAIEAQEAVHFKGTMKGIVVIPPEELAEMLISSVAYSLDGQNHLRKRSRWMNMAGEKVASENVTVLDDPHDARGMLSCLYDDEGVPTSAKPLIENGMLRSVLYDNYYAQMGGSAPTGNSVKRDPTDALNLYRHGNSTIPINLILEKGRNSVDSIVSEIREGAVIRKLASAEVNSITGGFALEVRCGQIIRDGEMTGSFDHALLVGNFYDALNNVEAVANDVEVVKNCIVPSVAFRGLDIIGNQ